MNTTRLFYAVCPVCRYITPESPDRFQPDRSMEQHHDRCHPEIPALAWAVKVSKP